MSNASPSELTPRQFDDPIDPSGYGDNGLSLVPPDTTDDEQEKYAFFSVENIPEPDFDSLKHSAETSENGAALLVDILIQTAQLEPKDKIEKYRTDEQAKIEKFNKLEAIKRNNGDSLSEEDKEIRSALSTQLTDSLQSLQNKIKYWEDINERVKMAYEYYMQTFFTNKDGVVSINSDKLQEEVYDITEVYDDNDLLRIIMGLNKRIPVTRSSARSSFGPNYTKQNVFEAERLVRLLILEEVGQISFADS